MKIRASKKKYIYGPVPENAPINPAKAYKDQGWPGWKKLFKELYGEDEKKSQEKKSRTK